MLVQCILSLLLMSVVSDAHVYDRKSDGRHAWKNLNLISTMTQSRSQMNIRVAHQGLLGMETVIPGLGEKSIFLREITNGKTFMQIVYQNKDVIVDCDLVRDQDQVDGFIRKFFKLTNSENWRELDLSSVVDRLYHGGNATVTVLKKHEPIPDDVKDIIDFESLKNECKDLHHDVTRSLKQKNKEHELNMNKNELDDFSMDEDEHHAKSRSKRSMFIYPGTNWCGKGSTASNYYDLGENIDTDKCCRAHDYCSVTIEGLSSQYNYFNYRLHTLSHCECDDQFHTCLKTSGDKVSGMVGNIFFNVMGNKCFILTKTKQCMKRSWWGKCTKYKKQTQAEIRDGLEY